MAKYSQAHCIFYVFNLQKQYVMTQMFLKLKNGRECPVL